MINVRGSEEERSNRIYINQMSDYAPWRKNSIHLLIIIIIRTILITYMHMRTMKGEIVGGKSLIMIVIRLLCLMGILDFGR